MWSNILKFAFLIILHFKIGVLYSQVIDFKLDANLYIGINNDIELVFIDTFEYNSKLWFDCSCNPKRVNETKTILTLNEVKPFTSLLITRYDTVKKTSITYIQQFLADPLPYPNLRIKRNEKDSVFFYFSFDSVKVLKKNGDFPYLYYSFYEVIADYDDKKEIIKIGEDEISKNIGLLVKDLKSLEYKIKLMRKSVVGRFHDTIDDYEENEEIIPLHKDFSIVFNRRISSALIQNE